MSALGVTPMELQAQQLKLAVRRGPVRVAAQVPLELFTDIFQVEMACFKIGKANIGSQRVREILHFQNFQPTRSAGLALGLQSTIDLFPLCRF
jgi:hypothetical protein